MNNDIRKALSTGSGFEGGKKRIEAYFLMESDSKKRADFLKSEYGVGGWSFEFPNGDRGFLDHNGKGLQLTKWSDEEFIIKLTWHQAQKLISEIIGDGEYMQPYVKQQTIVESQASFEI